MINEIELMKRNILGNLLRDPFFDNNDDNIFNNNYNY